MASWHILTLMTLLAVTACKKKNDVRPQAIVLQIDNRPPVDCSAGVLQRKCLWVREGDATNWHLFYNDIDGFTYEPGYRYLLDVQREPLPVDGVMDALPYKYTLVRIIEKTN